MSTLISKIYSRERAFFDFYFWDAADRMGVKKYVGEDLKTDVRIQPPPGKPGEVWYAQEEIDRLSRLSILKINGHPEFTDWILADAEHAWKGIEPYVKNGKMLAEVDEMLAYYHNLVIFWAAFNTVFFELPNYPEIDEYFKTNMLALREATQAYTEQMSIRFVEYLRGYFPQLGEYAHYVSPFDVPLYAGESTSESILAEVRDRARQGCFVIEGRVYLLENLENELARRGLEMEKIDVAHPKELKGASAYTGTATGPARVVFTMADAQKIEDGDILIAPMTIPDYVPYLKKTAGFVTDEGGVTCHAAIVARELKKPCIIGTKFATQVFKDGDMVELDAERGIVCKI